MKISWDKILKLSKERFRLIVDKIFFLSKWETSYERRNESNQITVRLGNGGYRWPGLHYRGDVFMFIEDMHQGIMPFSLTRREDGFEAKIIPENHEIEDMISKALEDRGYNQSLTSTAADFFRDAAQSMYTYGKIAYEIVYKRDDTGKINDFEFAHINPLSIVKIFNYYFQVIPWWVAKHSHTRVGIRIIPTNKMLYLEMPKELGGRRGLKKVLKRLAFLSKEVIPDFQMTAMKENRNVGFDVQLYSKMKYVEKGQVTKQFGWNQRKVPDRQILEYYSIFRDLKSELAQAVLREAILESINKCLNNSLLNLQTKIVLEGTNTPQLIKDELQNLQNGNLSFSALYKRVHQLPE